MKVSKYAGLSVSHLFVPIAIETLGPINEAGHSFLSELGRRLSTISDDPGESFFLFQRISILIQMFNEVAFRGTFDVEIKIIIIRTILTCILLHLNTDSIRD